MAAEEMRTSMKLNYIKSLGVCVCVLAGVGFQTLKIKDI